MEKESKRKIELSNTEVMGYAIEIMTADEILERQVVGVGNGAHINIPLKHKGKTAKIIIHKLDREEQDKIKKE